MSDLSGMSDKQLRDKKADLAAQREASKDQAAKAALRDQIAAIDKEFRRRALEAGKAAGEAVDKAAAKLDEVQSKQATDAVSALGRTIKRLDKSAKKDTDKSD